MAGRAALMAGSSAECLKTPSPAVAPVFSAPGSESSEAYTGVLARLNNKLRVIHGKDALQWILQVRKSPARWESIAFCATKEGLLLRIRDHLQDAFHPKEHAVLPLEWLVGRHCDPEAWKVVQAVPDYYPKQVGSEPKTRKTNVEM